MTEPAHNPARERWRIAYRQHRIIARESGKCLTDMMIFGHSAVIIGPNEPDGIRHIPWQVMRKNK